MKHKHSRHQPCNAIKIPWRASSKLTFLFSLFTTAYFVQCSSHWAPSKTTSCFRKQHWPAKVSVSRSGRKLNHGSMAITGAIVMAATATLLLSLTLSAQACLPNNRNIEWKEGAHFVTSLDWVRLYTWNIRASLQRKKIFTLRLLTRLIVLTHSLETHLMRF